MLLATEKIFEIRKKAIDAGLHKKRSLLMLGIAPAYVASLETTEVPADQVLSDLARMNEDGVID